MNYWQVAAGEGGRDYSSVFLQYGVMLIGAGDPGPYFEKEDYYRSRAWGRKVQYFARHVAIGDVVVLKRPHHHRWEIQAVGKVTGNYEWLEQFDDVEGWDLQHCRKTEWSCPKTKLVIDGLARGTFRMAHQDQARATAQRVFEEGERKVPNTIPPPATAISDEDLVEHLIDNGLRVGDAEAVIQTIWRIRRLAQWYRKHGRDLSEHEIRTFLIVPILLALEWSEQKMKIEWKNIDLSFFSDIYSRGNEPCMILESKRMGEGLNYAEKQIQDYARDFPDCHRLIVSDGIRYNLYAKQGEQWNLLEDFRAYMNLLRLKDRHPYLTNVKGPPDLFINLMPR